MHLAPHALEYFKTFADSRASWRSRNSFYHADVEQYVAFLVPRDVSVLQVGADSSTLLARLHASRALGIHGSEPMVNAIQKGGTHENVSYAYCQLSDVRDTYDYIIFSDVLGYVEDIEVVLREAAERLPWNGRIVITQYSALWEPLLRFASIARLRMPSCEQSWISRSDIDNFARLSGLETVRSGTRMLVPIYIPLVSALFNKYLAHIFPFTRLGIYHYTVLRKRDAKPAQASPSISIVVPARNEKGMIERIARELSALSCKPELIFIEGHSTDETWAEIQRVSEHYPAMRIAQQKGKGKGDAVRMGFDMATGDILTIYDADMTVPAPDMDKFYRAIADNRADFINGSRLVYPLEKQSMKFINFLGNKFFSLAFSWLLSSRLKDTLCGTKMLWREDYVAIQKGRGLFGDFDPFGDFDLLFGASKLNKLIIDLPIHYKERTYGTTSIQRWRHGWLLLKMVVFAARKIKFI